MSPSSGINQKSIAESKKLKKHTHQTLFNQTPTRKKQLMVPVKLNKQKQTALLQKALNSFSDLDLADLKYSAQRKSATLGNIHPFVFKALSNVFNTFCGPESQVTPKCVTHTNVPFLFSAQDNWDESQPPALLTQIFNIKQSVGNSIIKVGYLTLHYSKRKLQISSHLAENVPVLVEYLVNPLVEITNRCGAVNISEAKCMDCTLNLKTLQASNDEPTPATQVNESEVPQKISLPRSRPLLCIRENDVTPQPELTINPLIQQFPLRLLPPLPYYVTTQPVPESPTLRPTEIPSILQNKVHTPLFERHSMTDTPRRPTRVLSPSVAQNRAIQEFNKLCDRLNSVENQVLGNTSRIHGLECQPKVSNTHEDKAEIASLRKEVVNLKKSHTEIVSGLNKKLDTANQTIRDLTMEISEIKGMLRTPPPTCCSKTDTQDIITSVIDHMVDKFKEITVHSSPRSQNADVPPSDNSTTQPTHDETVTPPVTSQRRNRSPPAQRNRPPSPVQRNRPPSAAQHNRPPQHSGRQAMGESQPSHTTRAPDSPPPYTQTCVKIIGGSNCGKISNALRNTVPNIVVQATSGSTFDSVLGEIRSSERCDVMVIQGGVNEADTLVNMEDARLPLKLAIRAAKAKASKVIVMPPPPLSHPRLQSKAQRMSNIMRYEAQQARCEYVDVQSKYNDDRICGQYIIASDGKHVTKLGGGIYAYSLVDHLYNNHRQLNVNLNFCVNCQHTGHRFDNCHIGRSATRQHQHSSHEFTPATHTASPYTSQLRSPPNFTHSNRFQVLDDYNSRYLNNSRGSSSRQRR